MSSRYSIYQINESALKEKAYSTFKSNYVLNEDVVRTSPNTTDGDNEAIKAMRDVLDLDSSWNAQWIVSNHDDSYTVRFDKQDFRPVIVSFRSTIGNPMTFTLQFGENGNADYFNDDTPPDDPIIEISRYVTDQNSRFATMAQEFRKRTETIERDAGDKKAADDAAAQADQCVVDATVGQQA